MSDQDSVNLESWTPSRAVLGGLVERALDRVGSGGWLHPKSQIQTRDTRSSQGGAILGP